LSEWNRINNGIAASGSSIAIPVSDTLIARVRAVFILPAVSSQETWSIARSTM
jgi:hypothetical protein